MNLMKFGERVILCDCCRWLDFAGDPESRIIMRVQEFKKKTILPSGIKAITRIMLIIQEIVDEFL